MPHIYHFGRDAMDAVGADGRSRGPHQALEPCRRAIMILGHGGLEDRKLHDLRLLARARGLRVKDEELVRLRRAFGPYSCSSPQIARHVS